MNSDSVDYGQVGFVDISSEIAIFEAQRGFSLIANSSFYHENLLPSYNLLVVDSSIDDYQHFLREPKADTTEVLVLDASLDGLRQISNLLENRDYLVSSITILSHGDNSLLQLGASVLDSKSLELYRDEISGWSRYLGSDADILIYACDLAQDALGKKFVDRFAELTGADIAASTDLTGSTTLGGDWELEYLSGDVHIETLSWTSSTLLEEYDGLLASLIVANQTSNSISLQAPNGSGGFTSPTTLAVSGTGPSTVTLGDINGDGLEDILTTNVGSSNISLFTNNGVGGFNTPQTFAVGAAPTQLAVADVNRDGRLDVLALKNATNNFSVLLNNGTGGFAAAQNFATGTGPVGIGVADVNGDGNIDVFTANLNTTNVTVNLGNGAGSFGAATATSTVGSLPVDMTTGDLNGDGRMDFVVANRSSRNVSVGLGNGTGGFTVTNYGAGARPNVVILGDVNNDGALDIATANTSSTQGSILLNNGNGGFGGPTPIEIGSTATDIAFGDVNDDGNLDLLASATAVNQIAVLLGNGSGGFAAQPPLTTAVAPAGLAFASIVPDTTAPVLQGAVVNGSTLTLTYNESLDGGSDPAGGAYAVTVNGIARAVDSVDANGTTVTLTLASAVAAGETVALSYTPPATNPVQDVAGNDAIALTNRTVTNTTAPPADTTPPVFQSAVVNGSVVTLTYNEALDGASDPAAGAYAVTVNGIARAVDSVDANGTTVTLTLANAVAAGETVVLSYTPPATNPVQDVAGNDAIALTTQSVTNTTVPPADTTPPVFQSAVVNGSVVTLTYNEVLDGASDPAGGAYAVIVNGVARVVNSVDANGITVTLTLASAVAAGETVALSYTPPATNPVQDVAGNDAIALTAQTVTNITLPPADTTAPILQTAIVNGTSLVLTYNEVLDGASDPATGAYSVVVNGTQRTVNGVDANGTTVILTLASAVAAGDTVAVSYTVPGTNPVQDLAGNDAIALTAQTVTNTTLPTPSGGGSPTLIVANQGANSVSLYATNSSGGFYTPTTLAVGGVGPTTVTLGDINGDGLEDMLTTNSSSNNISLLINNGAGGFNTPQTFALSAAPTQLDVADVNRDSRLDVLALHNATNSFSVLLNNGTGGFAAAQTFATGTGPVGIGAADLNGDGNIDVFTANLNTANVSVNLGNGVGGFSVPTATATVGSLSVDMVTGDLNSDGRMDFVVANRSSRNVSVGLGNGTGGFTVTNYGAAARPNIVTLGDINNDGSLDIVTVNAGSTQSSILLNSGNGGFGGATPVQLSITATDILLGDINDDGNLDLLASNTSANQVAAFLGNGNGGFTPQTPLATAAAPAGLAFASIIPDTTAPILQGAVVNGSTLTLTYNEALDGASDPAGGAYTVTVNGAQRTVTSANANGTTVTLTLASPVVGGETVAISYVVPGTNPIQDAVGNDAIAFTGQAVTNTSPAPDTTPPVLQTATVNGSTLTLTYNEALDGASDPAGSAYTVTVNGVQRTVNSVDANGTAVTLNLASPVVNGETVVISYAVPGTNPIQDVAGNDAIALTNQTVTNTTTPSNPGGGSGSGLNSLVVANRFDSSISIFESDGAGGFSTQTTFSTGGNQPFAVAMADINGDGLNDVVVANRGSGDIALLINDGTGGFLAPQLFAVGNQPTHIVLKDINGDGIPDAIVANNSSDTVSILLGNTSGSFNPQTTLATGDGPWEVVIADLNGDSNLDLITVHFVGETVTVNLGDGQGNFAATSGTYAVGSRPEGLVLEDVNNDNILDFVVSNASSRNVSVALGNGSGGFGAVIEYPTGSNTSSPLALGDVNNDGFADIVVGNSGSDNVSIMLNNGNGTFGAATFFALGDSPFDIVLQDINGDGNLDILSADANSNTVTVLAGTGTGSFSPFTILAAGTAPVDMVFGSLSSGTGETGEGTPTLVNAIVSGTTTNSTVKLIYSERLNGEADPSASDYTVLVNGVARTISSVDILPGTDAKGTNVILRMANPILLGDVVTVSYTPGATAVQDLEGNAAAGFTNQSVVNLRDFTLTYDFMTVADVFDFTEFGYTYDYGYLNDFSVLPSTAANQDGLDVRKNAADMTPEEIDAYINAILTLKDTTILTNNGIEISLYDQFVAVHLASGDAIGRMAPDGTTMVNPAHNGPAFMAWHRLLLAEYENALQAVNPSVSLPFWDWTDLNSTLNIVLEDNFMGSDPTINGDIQTGYFALANGWAMRNDLSDGRWLGVDATPEGIGRGSRVNNPGTWRPGIENMLQMDAFNLFANNVERGTGAHNNAHGYIGGIMANVSASPNDPIFWMLHSNVDRLWAEWQVDDHWGTSFYAASGQNYGHNLNDPLFLWDNGAVPIAEDLRDLLVRSPGSTTWVTNGSGTIAGDLTNDGTVAPGNSPGLLNIQGDYTQTANGELTIELAGRNPETQYDVLKVDGTAKLDGTLNFYFLGDFAPKYGVFTFLKADAIEGSFSDINIFGLDEAINYKVFKSRDGKSFKIKMMGLCEEGLVDYGIAQTAQALYNDTDLSLYNPRFGRGLDMYIYGYSDMHGWDLNGEAALFDHSSHGGETNWYLPYDVDINEWATLLSNGATIPQEYMTPMDHSDHDHSDHDHSDHQHDDTCFCDTDEDHSEHDHSDHDMGDMTGGMDDHSEHDHDHQHDETCLCDTDEDHSEHDHSDHDMGDMTGGMGDHSEHDHSDHDMGDMTGGMDDHLDHAVSADDREHYMTKSLTNKLYGDLISPLCSDVGDKPMKV